jgi:two-component system chemotaxis response regulator CheY
MPRNNLIRNLGEDAPMIDPTGLRILIVDDNQFARSTAHALLRKLGFIHISEASSGAEGLGLLLSQPFDVLLTDWYMPEVSGAGVLQILRDDRVKCLNQNISTIVMTAYASSQNSKLAQSFGVREILLKPIDQRSLGQSILNLDLTFDAPVKPKRRKSNVPENQMPENQMPENQAPEDNASVHLL